MTLALSVSLSMRMAMAAAAVALIGLVCGCGSSSKSSKTTAALSGPRAILVYEARGGGQTVTPFDPDGKGVRYFPWEREVTCGHNPMLVARRASVWANNDGSNGITYDELLNSAETQRRSSEPAARGDSTS